MEVVVDASALPRQPLGATPYALTASTVTSAPNGFGVGDVVASLLDETTFAKVHGSGWVLADGRDVTGSEYATITGNTTVPDLRGLFLRGKNDGRSDGKENPDGDLPLGSYQADMFKSHSHGGTMNISASPTGNSYNPNGSSLQFFQWSQPTKPAGGNETRPRNATVNWFIKVN